MRIYRVKVMANTEDRTRYQEFAFDVKAHNPDDASKKIPRTCYGYGNVFPEWKVDSIRALPAGRSQEYDIQAADMSGAPKTVKWSDYTLQCANRGKYAGKTAYNS